jgi:hypothetical protein
MVVGVDCIDDVDVLRSGSTDKVLGHQVMAPSTIGTFLRSFTFGHIRQLDRLFATILERAWTAGAGPGDDAMIIDIDSTICEVHDKEKQGAGYGYTQQLGYHPLIATRATTGEVLHIRQRKGSAGSARGAKRFIEELVARVRRAGASGALTLRADSGFFSWKTIKTLKAKNVTFSITVPKNKAVTRLIEGIDDGAWVPIGYTKDGEAHIARDEVQRSTPHCSPAGAVTRSSPTAQEPPCPSTLTIAATPSSKLPLFATGNKARQGTTAPQGPSPRTLRGQYLPLWPTT